MADQTPATPTDDAPQLADMAPLVDRVKALCHESPPRVLPPSLPVSELARRFDFAPRKKGRPEVILSEDTFAELGHPRTASRSLILATFDPKLVNHGRIRLMGPDVDELKAGHVGPMGQVVVLCIDPERIPDPFDLENTQYLMHRLPGYMVRSTPGRLWVRLSKKGRKKGLDLHTVGSALVSAFADDFEGVLKAEVLFITRDSGAVEALEPIGAEAKILSGQHKKLVLGIDGEVECSELDCDTCDEQPVCDNLRDVVVKRRKERKKASKG